MSRNVLLLTCIFTAVATATRADDAGEAWESAAKKLQQATATVRIWAESPKDANQPRAVTVCSGLCVREGCIVTASLAGSDSPIRLTLPGGKQADARVRVIDDYSGLVLLKADTASLVPLTMRDAIPAVGAEVLTAAGWGLDQPLVSRGIVAGVERKLAGSTYPSLLQCDCSTTQTSTGAGLVDRQGRLLGVIVATDVEGGRRGWAYAVPASHVQRI